MREEEKENTKERSIEDGKVPEGKRARENGKEEKRNEESGRKTNSEGNTASREIRKHERRDAGAVK